MVYIPKKNNKARTMAFSLIICGFLTVIIASYIPYSWLWQLMAAVMIVLGVQLTARYVLSDYRYIIDDRDDGGADLIVYKRQGKNDVKVCHISLSYIELAEKSRLLKTKPDSVCNYVQNIAADTYTVMYTDGDRRVGIILECDSEFINAICERTFSGDGSGTKFAM